MTNDVEPLWWLTKDGDKSCLALYERHYSAYRYRDGRPRYQFVGPGFSIVLRTERGDAVFVWRGYIDDTIPKQEGVECSLFRNESQIQSSILIRQADAIADCVWPGRRHYTKVDPKAVGRDDPRHVPGYCFRRAGWRSCGMTQSGKLILERKARKPMTWDEFKKIVDEKLSTAGVDGSVRVGLIKYASHGRDCTEVIVTGADRGSDAALQVFNF